MADFFNGFEAGLVRDAGWAALGAYAPVTDSPRSGAYCCRINPVGTGTGFCHATIPGFGAAQAFVNPIATRFAFRANTLPASGSEVIHQMPGVGLEITAAGVLRLYPTMDSLGRYFDGSNALSPGQWYVIEVFSPVSGNITVRFYPDGSNPSGDEITWPLPHDQNLSNVVQFGKSFNRNGNTVSFDYDDVHAMDGVAGYLGDGKIIRLGGNSSTPTYDGFLKNPSLSTIDQVWNDIPFPTLPVTFPVDSNQTRAYSNSAVAVNQTIKHDPVSIPDRIKAVQTVMWAELPADAFLPPTMEELHRVGGVDVTTPLNFVGREVRVFSWYIWPSIPALADLNSSEVGVARGAGSTAVMNIYDLWLEVEYGPDWTPPPPDEGCVTPILRDIDQDLIAQFQGSDIGLVFLFEGRFLSSTLYLWTGAGELEWDGKMWLGAGSLIGLSQAKESSDLTAIGLTVSLSGVDEAIISAALQELRQGQICRAYIAAYSWYPTRGLQSTPYCFFQGRVDVPTIDDGAATAVVSLQLENQLVDFERQRVRFYDPQTQNVYFPGDRGFDYVAAIQDQKIFWGKSN
jgi:hypothetical protein